MRVTREFHQTQPGACECLEIADLWFDQHIGLDVGWIIECCPHALQALPAHSYDLEASGPSVLAQEARACRGWFLRSPLVRFALQVSSEVALGFQVFLPF